LLLTLFPSYRESPIFASDWTLDSDPSASVPLTKNSRNTIRHLKEPRLGFGQRLSPFEYNPFKVEMEPLRDCEDFCVNCVWTKNYSSQVPGTDSRPPMAAVAMDMISLVQFLHTLDSRHSKPIACCLKQFMDNYSLLSAFDGSFDRDVAASGYLWDLFTLAICLDRRTKNEKEGWDYLRFPTESLKSKYFDFREPRVTPSQRLHFPSGEVLGLSRYLRNESTNPLRSLSDLDASFLYSGPFRLKLTNRLSEHLTIDNSNQILLYWDREDRQRTVSFGWSRCPGDNFLIYQHHVVGKYHFFFLR
jgi:hypothetical protein